MSVVILNCSLYGTGNQCSCLSAGVMCARRSKPNTRRAASFSTGCSGAMVDVVRLIRSELQ